MHSASINGRGKAKATLYHVNKTSVWR